MKQIEVTIMGQSYVLGCPDGAERSLRAAVSRVDEEMSTIRDAGRVKARERIAVLAALNLAYALAEGPAPASGRSDAGSDEGANVGEIDIAALVQRIDQALGADGQLL